MKSPSRRCGVPGKRGKRCQGTPPELPRASSNATCSHAAQRTRLHAAPPTRAFPCATVPHSRGRPIDLAHGCQVSLAVHLADANTLSRGDLLHGRHVPTQLLTHHLAEGVTVDTRDGEQRESNAEATRKQTRKQRGSKRGSNAEATRRQRGGNAEATRKQREAGPDARAAAAATRGWRERLKRVQQCWRGRSSRSQLRSKRVTAALGGRCRCRCRSGRSQLRSPRPGAIGSPR